ncbi:TIGR03364 family FAD-dependent oxidoreductase [Hymenobacter ginsengisoli]|uniref:TIGR03364 family FAD-dependent oxidoreductase n=1 Tax=Hymenobacter ginsengisoli TaxID=1051626 RepID=A0ABP8QAM9_9BACT|nr:MULTISPECIES: TIGR03364 family FAD-dependent oxidoreductase [unclassified Hymenobacter]MBO2031639.1 TIGR03364 family FAD-dependent oxidoreductase [Hymenobacter sp. BT559]
MENSFDLIVVGAGVLGTFHAYFALQRGLNVLLLEKDARPREATVRNFGQIITSGMAEGEWFDFARVSLEMYQKIQAECDISIRQNGSLYLASTELELQVLAEKHARYAAIGYPSRLLTTAECRQRLPAVQASYCVGGLLFEQEVTAEPDLLIHRLLAYLTERWRLDYRPATPVQAVTANAAGCEVVDARGQRYRAAQVLVCTGRDCQFLFPEVFAQSDLQLCKLQMLATYPQPRVQLPGSVLTGLSIRRYPAFRNCPSFAQLLAEPAPEALQRWGIHLLFKQALDGSIIIGDTHEYAGLADAAKLDFNNADELNQLMLGEARRILDLPDWRIQRTWNGYYTQPKAGEIFQHSPDPRIHLVTGIGGKGMTSACGFAAQHIARLV